MYANAASALNNQFSSHNLNTSRGNPQQHLYKRDKQYQILITNAGTSTNLNSKRGH
jgi:hypothetical protein